ncbi:hypothetical protein ACSBR1_015560 [Camellia fascicularis]
MASSFTASVELDGLELAKRSGDLETLFTFCLIGKVLASKPLNTKVVSLIITGAWKLIVLNPLSSGHTVEEMSFQWCPFWVEARGLPFQNLTKQNGETLGNCIRRLIQVDSQNNGLLLQHSFLRIRVEINTQEPLPRGLWLKRPQGENES